MLFTMEIDRALIEHVAELARINLTESEIKEFLPQLKEIIKAFSEIQEVNTDNVEPSFHPIQLKNALREDIPKESQTNGLALRNTKHKKDGYFKGPKIL
jgi:aspartyl-tRNA(Asn)/glutamyl-tRNA(Gln) amidotransferase subunit C